MNKRVEIWMSAPARLAEVSLRERLAKLLDAVELCSAKPGTDEVHDLRVSIRRFSQALRIFGPLLAGKPVKAMRKALRPVMEAAARVRDLDVGMERLIEEGLEESDPLIEEMRVERGREEMALRGRLLLLRSKAPERVWPGSLHVSAKTPKARGEASTGQQAENERGKSTSKSARRVKGASGE